MTDGADHFYSPEEKSFLSTVTIRQIAQEKTAK